MQRVASVHQENELMLTHVHRAVKLKKNYAKHYVSKCNIQTLVEHFQLTDSLLNVSLNRRF